jgi:hypothetical protein
MMLRILALPYQLKQRPRGGNRDMHIVWDFFFC